MRPRVPARLRLSFGGHGQGVKKKKSVQSCECQVLHVEGLASQKAV